MPVLAFRTKESDPIEIVSKPTFDDASVARAAGRPEKATKTHEYGTVSEYQCIYKDGPLWRQRSEGQNDKKKYQQNKKS